MKQKTNTGGPLLSTTRFARFANNWKAQNAASTILSRERKQLAIQAIAGTSSISELASGADTSLKFIYTQKYKAEEALNEAFSENTNIDEAVLSCLSITKSWIYRLILALILICHSSFRNVCESLKDLFDVDISVGTVHNVVERAVESAKRKNVEENLTPIKVGAHDEIFQGRTPVLVRCDAKSTYCNLLSAVNARDSDTWRIATLEACEKGAEARLYHRHRCQTKTRSA